MKKLNDLTIEITQKCPNYCMHCSSLASLKSETYICKETVLEVAKQAFDLGLKRLSISGGEPLFHPDIKTLAFTKSSIFAAKDHGYYTEIHLVPNKINLLEIEQTVDTLVTWGVDQVSFLRLVPQGYAHKNRDQLVFNKTEIEIFTSLISKLNTKDFGKTTMRFGIPFSKDLKVQMKCNAGESKLIVRYDGKVLPCEAFKDTRFEDYILGDIYTDKLFQIMDIGSSHEALNCSKNKTSSCETCPAQVEYQSIA